MKKFNLMLMMLVISLTVGGCGDSKKETDLTKPIITLIGANPQTIERGNTYVELGATTDDSTTVMINSSAVDTTTVGSYTVSYTATDSSGNNAIGVTRVVNIVDTTAPVLQLHIDQNRTIISKSRTYIISGIATDETGLKSVVVTKGTEENLLDLEGENFTMELSLIAGENEFIMTATDDSNNTTSIHFSIYLGHTVAAGGSHSGALKNNTLYVWGRNNYGQIGLGYTSKLDDNQDDDSNVTHPDIPVRIDTPSKFVALSFNQNYSLAIDENGSVYSWGYNRYGELGRGNTLQECGSKNYSCGLTIEKINSLSNIVMIEAGYSHALALQSNGTLWSWGTNKNGELGTGDTNSSFNPVKVIFDTNDSINIVQISAGSDFSCVLDNNGQVWAWGKNNYSQIGQGEKEDVDGNLIQIKDDQLTPIKIIMPENVKIISIATGKGHVLALGENNKVYGWGLNASSQIGYYGYQFKGTDEAWERYIYAPKTIIENNVIDNEPVVDVYANGNSSYIVRQDTKIYPWGQYGETLSNGKQQYNNLDFPEDKLPDITEIKDVSAGALHLVAVRKDDTVFTWRWSFEGSLGGGETTTDKWFYNYPILPSFE